jgi:RNA polymerase sigma-70 factor (ECF subfamily)
MPNDEPTLITRAQRDPSAFGPLYDRYVARIYAYVQREVGNTALAQDIVSITFEKALKNLPRYRWRGTSFGAWLYQIARNEVRMHYRRRSWLTPLLDRFKSPVDVEQQVQRSEAQGAVSLALGELSESDQELLRLRYYEDLSNVEIAEVLNKSANAVGVALHRALHRLRQQLETQEAQEAIDHARV